MLKTDAPSSPDKAFYQNMLMARQCYFSFWDNMDGLVLGPRKNQGQGPSTKVQSRVLGIHGAALMKLDLLPWTAVHGATLNKAC